MSGLAIFLEYDDDSMNVIYIVDYIYFLRRIFSNNPFALI